MLRKSGEDDLKRSLAAREAQAMDRIALAEQAADPGGQSPTRSKSPSAPQPVLSTEAIDQNGGRRFGRPRHRRPAAKGRLKPVHRLSAIGTSIGRTLGNWGRPFDVCSAYACVGIIKWFGGISCIRSFPPCRGNDDQSDSVRYRCLITTQPCPVQPLASQPRQRLNPADGCFIRYRSSAVSESIEAVMAAIGAACACGGAAKWRWRRTEAKNDLP